eukprot:664829-Amphidinium_carterae.2
MDTLLTWHVNMEAWGRCAPVTEAGLKLSRRCDKSSDVGRRAFPGLLSCCLYLPANEWLAAGPRSPRLRLQTRASSKEVKNRTLKRHGSSHSLGHHLSCHGCLCCCRTGTVPHSVVCEGSDQSFDTEKASAMKAPGRWACDRSEEQRHLRSRSSSKPYPLVKVMHQWIVTGCKPVSKSAKTSMMVVDASMS